ncbi:tetratricopeptide repeat-containing sensor histidine kinase [Myroides injenensis]|uniref:two-component sensor histidine kinase n=1 Tax=Myroides injenensis TaxID=1183151 RepID=UPI000287A9B7|nr:two-component sensor histidine kinase [Myroides injenensis]
MIDDNDSLEITSLYDNLSKTKDSSYYRELNQLFAKTINLKNTEENRRLAVKLLRESKYDNDSIHYYSLLNKTLQNALDKKDTYNEAEIYELLASQFYQNIQLDSAYHNLIKAEHIYYELRDSTKYGKIALKKAQILFENGIYTESETEAIKAIKYLRNKDNVFESHRSHHLLGIVLTELYEFDEALIYFRKARNLLKEVEKNKKHNNHSIAIHSSNILNNLSHLYYKKGEYEKAKKYALKGIYENKDIEDVPALYSTLSINLINAKLALKEEDNLLFKIDKIIEYEKMLQKNGHYVGGYPSILLAKARYYALINKPNSALYYTKLAYKEAKKEKRTMYMKEALTYLAINDVENQKLHIENLIKLNDSINRIERISKNKFARIEYQADELSQLNKKLIINNKTITLIAVLIIFALIIAIIFYYQYAKNKRLKFQHKNQLANEKIFELILEQKELSENAKKCERKRIAKELHDGIINRIFTSRFHLMQLDCINNDQKQVLISELHKAEQEISEISHLLNQEKITDSNPFDQLLEDLITNQQNSFNTKFILNMDKDINWDKFTSEDKLNIYRIFQEALQNINKYSKATIANIKILKTKKPSIVIKISDNGIGFEKLEKYRGQGIKNMKSRAKDLNANLNIKSIPDLGVSITLEIKYP